MQNRDEQLTRIPDDIAYVIANYLSISDVYKLSRTCKANFRLFNPLFKEKLVPLLLANTVDAEYSNVKKILNKNIEILPERQTIIDNSGRTFLHISAFEYAVWALDKWMWETMLECIPKNDLGSKIMTKLFDQYEKIKTEGVTYHLDGEIITEKQFDFEKTIISALKTQIDALEAPAPRNEDAIAKQWREGVGGAQNLLPMHAVFLYTPENGQNRISNTSQISKYCYLRENLKRFTNLHRERQLWFAKDSGLGRDFAILSHPLLGRHACKNATISSLPQLHRDLHIVTDLHRKRTKELVNLESQLAPSTSKCLVL